MRDRARAAGFTLLEVMVAVAVLGIAMAAVIRASAEMTGNAHHLEERTFAQWVAGNVLAEHQAQRFWDSEGREGQQAMGPTDWHWRLEVTTTPNPDFRRLDVHVHRDPDADDPPVATMTGLVLNPQVRATSGAPAPGEPSP